MIRFLAFCAAVATFAACNDWTEMETVDSKVEKPWEQDPALWAEYTAALRAYKQSEHFIVYARLHNSPEKASTFQGYLDDANLCVTNCGTRSSKLELIDNRMKSQKTTFETLKSENEDIDVTETAIDLKSAEMTYEAALMATGKVMQTTLLNFI